MPNLTLQQVETIVCLAANIAREASKDGARLGRELKGAVDASPEHIEAVYKLTGYLADLVSMEDFIKNFETEAKSS